MNALRRHVPRVVLIAAVGLIAMQVLLSLGYAMWVYEIPGGRKFNLDAESNVPTWWSSFLMSCAGLAAFGLAACNRLLRRMWIPWLLVGLGLLALSLEEIAAIHEDVGTAAGGGADMVSIWPLIYLPVAVAGAWILIRAARDLPRPLAAVALAGLGAFVAVMGVELLAVAAESYWSILIEENLEFLGTGLLLVALAAALIERAAPFFVPPATALTAAGEATPMARAASAAVDSTPPRDVR